VEVYTLESYEGSAWAGKKLGALLQSGGSGAKVKRRPLDSAKSWGLA